MARTTSLLERVPLLPWILGLACFIACAGTAVARQHDWSNVVVPQTRGLASRADRSESVDPDPGPTLVDGRCAAAGGGGAGQRRPGYTDAVGDAPTSPGRPGAVPR